MDSRDFEALLIVARMQTVHPSPPINPDKLTHAFAVFAAGLLDDI